MVFKGTVGTSETVRRLAVLTVLLEDDAVSEARAAEFRREIDLTMRGCRGHTTQKLFEGHHAAHTQAEWN
jgi:hypothetical protein